MAPLSTNPKMSVTGLFCLSFHGHLGTWLSKVTKATRLEFLPEPGRFAAKVHLESAITSRKVPNQAELTNFDKPERFLRQFSGTYLSVNLSVRQEPSLGPTQ